MVFKHVHMKVFQHAVDAGDDLDVGGFCTLHASFADMHVAYSTWPYAILKQGIRHRKTGRMASQNRPHDC